jgi:hypothetical protein
MRSTVAAKAAPSEDAFQTYCRISFNYSRQYRIHRELVSRGWSCNGEDEGVGVKGEDSMNGRDEE